MGRIGWGEGWGCVHHAPCDSAVVCVSPQIFVSLCFAHYSLHEALAKDETLTALGKVLHLLDGILDGQVGAPGRGWGCLWSWGQGPGPAHDRWPVQGRGGRCRTTWTLSVALCPGPFPQQSPGQGHEHPLSPLN